MPRKTTKIVYEALEAPSFMRPAKYIIDGGPDVDVSFDIVTGELRLHGSQVDLRIPHVRRFHIENVEVLQSVYEG
jgi:hypothetical protein